MKEKKEREGERSAWLTVLGPVSPLNPTSIIMDKSWVDVEAEVNEEATVPKDTATWWVGR